MNLTSQRTRVEDNVLRIAVATAERGTSLFPNGMVHGIEALRDAGRDYGGVLLVSEGANFCAEATSPPSPQSQTVASSSVT